MNLYLNNTAGDTIRNERMIHAGGYQGRPQGGGEQAEILIRKIPKNSRRGL
jgi:hypothetical protein